MSKETHYDKGMDLFTEDRLEQAIEQLNQALEIDPDFGDVLHALAMTHYHAGDISKAIEIGERFLKVEPDNVHAYTSLSMLYNTKGFIQKAEEMAEQASKLSSGQGDI